MSSNMGRKRKNHSADKEEELRRKNLRLERKLAKEQSRQQLLSPSSDEDIISEFPEEVVVQDVTHDVIVHASQNFDPESNNNETQGQNEDYTQDSQPEVEIVQPSQQKGDQISDLAPGTSTNPVEMQLDDDILELLGDAPKTESALGKPIHKDLASRWNEILSKGLLKEVKEKLLNTYQIPNNCEMLLAPLLNPEAKAALPDALVKRDSYLMYKQRQLGLALSALGNAIDLIITNQTSDQTSKQALLKPLSDAGRILCNLHFSETKTRRKLVVASVNTNIKEALTDTYRDKMLFGENVTEKLRAAKTIKKSGEMLKNTTKFFPKNNFNTKQQNRLNSKPHRKMESKQSSQPTSEPARYRQQHAPPRQQQAPPAPRRARSPPRKPYQQRH